MGLERYGVDVEDPDATFSLNVTPFVAGNSRPAGAANNRGLGIHNGTLGNQGRILVIEKMYIAVDTTANGRVLILARNGTGFPANFTGGGNKGRRDGRLGIDWSAIGDDIVVAQDDGALATSLPGGTTAVSQLIFPLLGYAPFPIGPLYLAPQQQLYVTTSLVNMGIAWHIEGHLTDTIRRK